MRQVGYGASFIEFFSEEAKRVYGDIIPAPLAGRRLFVLKQVLIYLIIFSMTRQTKIFIVVLIYKSMQLHYFHC